MKQPASTIEAKPTEPFEVRNRWTKQVQFTANIAIGLATTSLKIGAAVKWAVDCADLSIAVLIGADLSSADLRSADLSGADLSSVDLRSADLRSIRADLYDVLVSARAEAPAFLAAIREGRVDGSTYNGTCACLVGTIANVRGVSVDEIGTNSSRPIERFMLCIKPGDMPDINPVSALVEQWTAAFVGEAA